MLEKTFQPAEIEPRIAARWEKAGAFKAGAGSTSSRPAADASRKPPVARPYCIVIPPPNVTGSLHMGHALNNTLQDVLVRYERMRGRDVLWQPGTDHAGIATQMVVERKLAQENRADRRTLGREAFLKEVWAWKEQSGGTIVAQLKRLGASCDWSRERFTMDAGLSKAVTKVFVDLYNTVLPDGTRLIYRDKRLVNWDPQFQTAISDLEVEQIEVKGSFKWTRGEVDTEGNPVAFDPAKLAKVLAKAPGGHMYYFNYPLLGVDYDPDDPATYVTVATTRPETMLGDTAVAVHPEHPRLAALIGRKLVLPLVGREIPIIGDAYADPEKGTGAVKITPAHDFNDFEVGKRHAAQLLAPINIFDAEARVNANAPAAYHGFERFKARLHIVEDLASSGHLARIEPHTHPVPHGDRSGVPVEPWLTDQWYVNAGELAKPALKAVQDGKTRFIPERFGNDYARWLDPATIQPWCISRQLWWGHQIPAWYGPDGKVFVAADETAAHHGARTYYGTQAVTLVRDPDVLDTWFSSALWPFSTLGWPDATPELARYYPTTTLVTGFDIIFFWVARMMMMGLHVTGEVPFADVVIHGLVRDQTGAKMSKSKGNVVDPLVMIDEFGADALRFTMASMAAQGSDVKFSKQRIEGYRNFATKLWNAARFAEMNDCARVPGFDPKAAKGTVNQWVIGETQRAAAAVTAGIESYKFNEAAAAAYAFVWGVVCDWYLELVKPQLMGEAGHDKAETRATVAWVLDQSLKLLHPFMPFITEELWAQGEAQSTLLALSAWPELEGLAKPEAGAEIGWVVALISEVRSVRTEMNVPAGATIAAVMCGGGTAVKGRVERNEATIQRLARVSDISFAESPPTGAALIVLEDAAVALPLTGVVDMAVERTRLSREIAKTTADLAKAEAWLGNASNVEKSPEHVVTLNRERVAEGALRVTKLKAALQRIEG